MRRSGNWPTNSPAATPVAAIRRPIASGAARHASRSAISPKQTGRTSWPTQIGTPAAICVAAVRSVSTIIRLARQSSTATAPATHAEAIEAVRRGQPSGRKLAVASDKRRPSRAASAAPKNPTHSVRCCTKGPEPGIPILKSARTGISASGNNTMAARQALAAIRSRRPSQWLSAPLRRWRAGTRCAP